MTDAEADALAFAITQPAPWTAAQTSWLCVSIVLALMAGWLWLGMD